MRPEFIASGSKSPKIKRLSNPTIAIKSVGGWSIILLIWPGRNKYKRIMMAGRSSIGLSHCCFLIGLRLPVNPIYNHSSLGIFRTGWFKILKFCLFKMDEGILKKPRIYGFDSKICDCVLTPNGNVLINCVLTSKGNVLINLHGSEVRLDIHKLMTLQPGQSIHTGLRDYLVVKWTSKCWQIHILNQFWVNLDS